MYTLHVICFSEKYIHIQAQLQYISFPFVYYTDYC